MTENSRSLYRYFAKWRAIAITKYRNAALWVQRKEARSQALHFGRLMRKMEKSQ